MDPNNTIINLVEFEKLSSAEQAQWLDSITDDQAINSDEGGDSDADDFPEFTPLPANTSRRQTKRSFDEISGDFDSDDSVADPNFYPEQEACQVPAFDSSSDDDEPLVNLVHRSSTVTDVQNSQEQGNDFLWTKSPYLPHAFQSVTFHEFPGPRISISDSPIDIFSKILGNDFLEKIVTETNRYAIQNNNAIDLTVEELKAFIGMLIIMGFNPLPSLRLYWSSDPNFHNSRISAIMPLKRFLKILRFLHINDNENMLKKGEAGFDKLHKVRPMITYLSDTFLNVYTPAQNLAVDESMVAFKGRTHLKQYMPLKPIKRGIKIWALACSKTGFLLKFSVYEGKKESDEEGPLGEKTVLELTKPFENKNYCIYFDNFFTSFTLLLKLLDRKLYGCGTMRPNRKNFPKDLLVSDKDLEQGEFDNVGTSNITVSKWKDRGKKCVLVASTMHSVMETSTVERMTKEGVRVTVGCPKSIDDYNRNMGGVDLFDQLHSCYSIAWKSRKWWMKLFYYMIDACIVNSYVLYKAGASTSQQKYTPKKQLVFRSILANQLIGTFSARKIQGSWFIVGKNKVKKLDGRSVNVENSLRLTNVGDHLPTSTSSRRCARCSTEKKPKRSSIACTKCQVALCLPCFAPFHNK
ncbi:hypothetical protein PPYR_06144 [Photinus pyralis]|uniref:PiggyBac transposable element-derived protein domain-containing protein n=3 Tax=Photinus pyralis TaxID=7054 RepID=A0A5N4AST1_PHOPY|nr:piggyBac transposable element-derived protein 4-like [Photinus pyralis]KAB0800404.1 hypothetical protein PPYR_06144 [Photinus pyralis]